MWDHYQRRFARGMPYDTYPCSYRLYHRHFCNSHKPPHFDSGKHWQDIKIGWSGTIHPH